jgi:hypothetical protein
MDVWIRDSRYEMNTVPDRKKRMGEKRWNEDNGKVGGL